MIQFVQLFSSLGQAIYAALTFLRQNTYTIVCMKFYDVISKDTSQYSSERRTTFQWQLLLLRVKHTYPEPQSAQAPRSCASIEPRGRCLLTNGVSRDESDSATPSRNCDSFVIVTSESAYDAPHNYRSSIVSQHMSMLWWYQRDTFPVILAGI